MKETCVLILGFVAEALAGLEGFVVGGAFAKVENHPHSAFLNVICVINNVRRSWICGASVVNQKILLTAAHCLEECSLESKIAINLAHGNRQKGVMILTIGFVIHEYYDTRTCSNDLALLKTKSEIPLGTLIQRVALMRNPPYSEKATIAGWGVIDEHLTMTLNLKHVDQQMLKRDKCVIVFGDMPSGTFCAASPHSRDEYPAEGDSGCALLVNGFIQIGLVSYKADSAAQHIIVYTDVGYFYDWIKSNSKALFCYQNKTITKLSYWFDCVFRVP